MLNSLYNNNHQLNFNEAVRRIAFWASHPDDLRAIGAISMLARALEREQTNLYFEEKV